MADIQSSERRKTDMTNSGADKALAGYFDDLLGGASEDDTKESPAPEQAHAPTSTAAPAEASTEALQQASAEIKRETKTATEQQAPLQPAPRIEAASEVQQEPPPAAPFTAPVQAPPNDPPQAPPHDPQAYTVHSPAPQRQAQPSAVPESFRPMDLSMLEEQKRLKLQRLLSQQVVTHAPPKTETHVATETEAKTAVVEQQIEQKVTPAPAQTQPVVESAPVVVEETAVDVDEISAAAQRYLVWGDNGRPLWAEGEFDVLLFDVAGLSLAVPLVALGHIVPLDSKLTHLQGQSEWFMGILSASVGDIRTVNTALFVMPERYKPNFLETAKYVVTIDGLPWGLAVDDVHQPIRLGPDDVKWRTERSKRPWLAGTVKSHMCALIDIPQMAHELELSDKNRH